MGIGKTRLSLMAIAGAAAITSAACASSTAPSAPPQTTTAGPTFSQQIQAEILNPACVPCHTDVGRTPSGGMNLKAGVAYSSLVNVASSGKAGAVRVIPGNPTGSYIIQKLEGAADIVGLRMPRNGPPYLTDAQVALIKQWIQQGAPNN